MPKRYWLHRVSHEWEVSYSLLEQGLLSTGWPSLMGTGVLEAALQGDENAFKKATAGWGPGRWGFWNFSQFRPGDVVAVPLFAKEFAILEVTGQPFEITALAGRRFQDKNGVPIFHSAHHAAHVDELPAAHLFLDGHSGK
jgi:hypothetical protein